MTDTERIKEKIDIVSFINDHVSLKKSGSNYKACCPFHSEKTPSFYVSPQRQVFHCFGCGKGGDLFTFFMEMEKVEFPEALRILASKAGIQLTQTQQMTQQQKLRERIYQVNHLMEEYYHFLLTKHKTGENARAYLHSRGIVDRMIETFSLGYAPSSWDAQFLFLTKKGYKPYEIEHAGLVIKGKKGSYYDRFRGRVMFPIRDHRGQHIGFAGRLLNPNAKEAKYINSPETPVYTKGKTLYGIDITKDAIKREKAAILVEGEFDLLSSFQAGVSNVVAIKGTALTENQIMLLRRFTDKLIFALDSDIAGDAAAKRGIVLADKSGFLLSVVRMPVGKDPDDCIRENIGLWKNAIKRAIPIYDYIIASSIERNDPKTVEGKRSIGNEVIPFLSSITNPVVQGHYIRNIAQTLGVSEESIVLAIKRIEKGLTKKTTVLSYPSSEGKARRQERVEEVLLAVLLQTDKEKIVETIISLKPDDFYMPALSRLYKTALTEYKTKKQLPLIKALKSTPSELQSTLDRLVLLPIDELFTGNVSARVERLRQEVKATSLRRKMRSITTKIRKVDAESNRKKNKDQFLRRLNTELSQVTKELKTVQQSVNLLHRV